MARKRPETERPAASTEPAPLRLSCVFYRTDSGNEPVDKIEYRVIFMIDGSSMVLLHGFTKNSAKTKKADIDLANKRRTIWEKNR